MHPAYMLLVIPFFFLFMGIEWLYGYLKRKNLYRLNDSVTNLLIGTGQQVFGLVFKAMLFGVYIWVYDNYAFIKIPGTWWSFLLALVVFDFIFYWAHRWGHEMNIFWGAHLVHHQSEEYNLSVALRQSWFHNLIAFPLFLPIPLMGFEPLTFGAAAVVHTLSQFWIHTKVVGKLHPWFEYWFNTPSHHRVHHAINPKYIDKNHAGLLMIWDRLFGTFKAEEENDEIYYGITTPLNSWNPAWANIHYYVEMFQKARNMKWRDKLKMIWERPGWLPSYMGGYQAPQEVNAEAYNKYNADSNKWFRLYAVLQFFLLLIGATQYMAHYAEISVFYKIVFFALILITMLIIGAIFENRRWIVYAEYARLALVMISLNTFYYFWHLNWFMVMVIGSAIAFTGFVVLFTYSHFFAGKKVEAVPSE
ncbi:MAG: sterol desaturase family protein [Chitinophagales bacterium]|nr:sterol desaturase family protein [Chitinophagales bacterium]